ncbi:MAG: hypothetical protein ACOC8H_00015 [bacterium]
MHRICILGLTAVLTFCPSASQALADAESDFEMLFGEKAREVKASTSTEDDAAFAGELLEAAGSLADEPKLQLLLYQKAYSYGSRHPAGYAAALKALELWATAAPDDLAEVRQRRLELLKARYEAARGGERKASANEYLDALLSAAEAEAQAGQPAQADALYAEAFPLASHLHSPLTSEIVRRRRALAAEVAAAKQLDEKREELQARLSANPKDTGVRKQLVILYLLDDDKPDKAKALVNGDLPATFKSCLALVTQPADETSESEALKLAEWYAQVAAKANTRTGKAIALRRAVGYYERVLELHTKQDAVRLKAKLALENLSPEKASITGLNFELSLEHKLVGSDLKWPHGLAMVGPYVCVREGTKQFRVFNSRKRQWAPLARIVRAMGTGADDTLALITAQRRLEIYGIYEQRIRRQFTRPWPSELPTPEDRRTQRSSVSVDLQLLSYSPRAERSRPYILVVDLQRMRLRHKVPVSINKGGGRAQTSYQSLIGAGNFLVWGDSHAACIYDLDAKSVHMRLPSVNEKPYPRQFASDVSGRFLLSHAGRYIDGSGAGLIECFDVVARRKLWEFDLRAAKGGGFAGCALSSHGPYAIIGTNHKLLILDRSDGQLVSTLNMRDGQLLEFCENSNGDIVALRTPRKSGRDLPPPTLMIFEKK